MTSSQTLRILVSVLLDNFLHRVCLHAGESRLVSLNGSLLTAEQESGNTSCGNFISLLKFALEYFHLGLKHLAHLPAFRMLRARKALVNVHRCSAFLPVVLGELNLVSNVIYSTNHWMSVLNSVIVC